MVPIEQLLEIGDQHSVDRGRPFVTLSYAQSLDGSITAKRGAPALLSGDKALELTHSLRAANDAILVGIGTVLADDPQLTTRHVSGPDPQTVILDSHLRFPLDAKMLHNPKKPWIFSSHPLDSEKKTALEAFRASVIPVEPLTAGGLDLTELLKSLVEKGVTRLMVEGGAHVISSFLAGGFVDLVVMTIAPVFIGGVKAVEKPLVGTGQAGSIIAHFPKLREMHFEKLGSDLVVWGRLAAES